MIGITLQNRYYIEEELGHGGMGIVYRAQDRLLNRPVAIKVISESGIGTSGKARLLAEAQAAARLNHPNIVAVYDAGESENVTYLVMELIEGSSLRGQKNLSLPQTLDVMIQICSALEQAHTHGIIHRDLKPENIFLTPTRIAKLMDFGLARRVDVGDQETHMTTEGAIVGTMAYIAPEIITGGQASPRSDLYALGLILYEMVTGRPAYSGKDLIAILSQHLHATVEPPSTHNPHIPPELEALILRLLDKQPDNRPASAQEVRLELEALRAGEPLPASEARSDAGAALDRIVRGRLVARDHELKEMLACWRLAQQGESRVLLLSGEPGIGKTRLVKEMVTRVALQGGKTLLGECFLQGGAPYAPLSQTIEQALLPPLTGSSAPPAQALNLPNLVLADLLMLAPSLITLYDLPPNPPLDPQAEQQRMFAAYISLCERLASNASSSERSAGLLLVIDDAHWADRGSLDMLYQLARRAARGRWKLLIVLTYREVELSDARALNEIIDHLVREHMAERIKLNRFSLEQTGQLLTSLFAEPPSDDLRDSIHRETEGNPFFIEEICKTLIEAGKIYRANGHWERAAGSMHLPQSVRVAIEGRIARLPENVQEILRLAAVFGRRFDFNTLAQACTSQLEDDLIDALEQAQRVQILEETGSANGGSFAFTHALIPTALLDGLSGLRSRKLHRKAIDTITRLHPEDYESLAHHAVLAADDNLALQYLEKAGRRARDLYANQDAIRFLSEALSLLPEDSHEHAVLQQRFDLLFQRSLVYEVLPLPAANKIDIAEMLRISAALDDGAAESLARQCDAHTRMAAYALEYETSLFQPSAEKALELARLLQDPQREGQALSLLAHREMLHYNDKRCAEYFQQAIECLRRAGLQHAIALNLNWLAMVSARNNKNEDARAQLDEAIRISRAIGDRRLEATNLRRIAVNLSYENKFAEALPFAQQACDLFRQVGDRSGECHSINVLGLLFGGLMQLEESAHCYRQAMSLGEEIDHVTGVFNAAFNLTESYYPQKGAFEEAIAFIDEQIQRPLFAGDPYIQRVWQDTKNDQLTQMGQYAAALEIAQEVIKIDQTSTRNREFLGYSSGRVAFILTEMERFAEAQTWLEQLDQVLRETGSEKMRSYVAWNYGYWHYRQVMQTPPPPPEERQARLQEIVTISSAAVAAMLPQQIEANQHIELQVLKMLALIGLDQPSAAEEASKPLQTYLAEWPRPRQPAIHLALAVYQSWRGQTAAALETLRPAYERVQQIISQTTRPDYRASYLATYLTRRILALWEQLGQA